MKITLRSLSSKIKERLAVDMHLYLEKKFQNYKYRATKGIIFSMAMAISGFLGFKLLYSLDKVSGLIGFPIFILSGLGLVVCSITTLILIFILINAIIEYKKTFNLRSQEEILANFNRIFFTYEGKKELENFTALELNKFPLILNKNETEVLMNLQLNDEQINYIKSLFINSQPISLEDLENLKSLSNEKQLEEEEYLENLLKKDNLHNTIIGKSLLKLSNNEQVEVEIEYKNLL